jgi:hypothetical protein
MNGAEGDRGGPPSKSNRNGWRGGGRERAAIRWNGEEWNEWVDGSDGEGENLCDIPGDECDDQGWVQGDANYDEESCNRCGKRCQPSRMKIWTTNKKMNLRKG